MYIAADGVHGSLWRDDNFTTVDVPGAAATRIFGSMTAATCWAYATSGQVSHGVLVVE